MRSEKKNGAAGRLFLKSMLYTAAAIALLFIGYFSARYFFGGV